MRVNRSNAVELPTGLDPAGVGFRPLYRQVKDLLIGRIASGAWRAGEPIPSETDIAAELATSQGTVRKALDEMAGENLVVRRQGRGTFVARHDDARILFQFFKIVPDDGEPVFPESRVLSISVAPADPETASRLDLRPRARAVRLVRERSLRGRVVILERIALPAATFGPLARSEIPNNLYEVFSSRFGVTIARARERLKAVPAGPEEARSLGVREGEPLLLVDRRAEALDGRPAEWRRSWCVTTNVHYLSDLR